MHFFSATYSFYAASLKFTLIKTKNPKNIITAKGGINLDLIYHHAYIGDQSGVHILLAICCICNDNTDLIFGEWININMGICVA